MTVIVTGDTMASRKSLRLTASCGRVHDGQQSHCVHPQFPCGRETHDGVYARFYLADKSFSQECSGLVYVNGSIVMPRPFMFSSVSYDRLANAKKT